MKITIASPCPVSWESMREHGSASRYCDSCSCVVHDVSKLSASEVEALLSSPGRVCVQIYRRPDGTVKTRDCAVIPITPNVDPRFESRLRGRPGPNFQMPELRGRVDIVREKPKGRKPDESIYEALRRQDEEAGE